MKRDIGCLKVRLVTMRERKAEVIFDRQAQSTNTLWG